MESLAGCLIGLAIVAGFWKGCDTFEKNHPMPTTKDLVKSCHDYCIDIGTKKFSYSPSTGCACIFGKEK